MGALDLTLCNNIVDATLGNATLTATTAPIHVRYMTVMGSPSVNGTEVTTGGGYTSGTGAPTLAFANCNAQVAASSAILTTTNMPACNLVGIELWDSNATPKRKWQGALSSQRTISAGDTITFASGAITAGIP